MKKKLPILLLGLAIVLSACKKFITVGSPADRLTSTDVFDETSSATAAILGIYEEMMENNAYFANGGITFYAGLSSDELLTIPSNSQYDQFQTNQLLPSNQELLNPLWGNPYSIIYRCNAAIAGLRASAIDSPMRRQLTGEALFVRAFCHFYLTNFFGPVPLSLTTSYQGNALLYRSSRDSVYAQIVSDLQTAETLLSYDYLDNNNQVTTTGRTRPNKAVAMALLSRTHLYLGNWSTAQAISDTLIRMNDRYELLTDLTTVFLKDSREALWQLSPVIPEINTGEGYMFVQTDFLPNYGFLDSILLASFSSNDERLAAWTGAYSYGGQLYHYPAKYKVNYSPVVTEYNTVFRLAEQYLIHAEASIKLGRVEAALLDLNVLRQRAGLEDYTSTNPDSLDTELRSERKHEFFCEWGHRWFDLKRTNTAGLILAINKPGWQPSDTLYPLPQLELQNDPHLEQNPGY